MTGQRHRFVFSWLAEPRPFDRGHESLGRVFNNWRISGVCTVGSGRLAEARVFVDPNWDNNDIDSNDINERLPGYGRNVLRWAGLRTYRFSCSAAPSSW
ncbi:MAG TPA: hypothetical protein VJX16_19865 [Terriglobales bacterium]|nr:hypothetical protein [Terriglobales bacterium]